MDKDNLIGPEACRLLREISTAVTQGCMITKAEYLNLILAYKPILDRLEREGRVVRK